MLLVKRGITAIWAALRRRRRSTATRCARCCYIGDLWYYYRTTTTTTTSVESSRRAGQAGHGGQPPGPAGHRAVPPPLPPLPPHPAVLGGAVCVGDGDGGSVECWPPRVHYPSFGRCARARNTFAFDLPSSVSVIIKDNKPCQ